MKIQIVYNDSTVKNFCGSSSFYDQLLNAKSVVLSEILGDGAEADRFLNILESENIPNCFDIVVIKNSSFASMRIAKKAAKLSKKLAICNIAEKMVQGHMQIQKTIDEMIQIIKEARDA